MKMSKGKIELFHLEASRWRDFGASADRRTRYDPPAFGRISGLPIGTRSKIDGNSAVRLTRGGRGTRMGGGPR